ncbi:MULTISPECIES: ABC transporter permease subunit [Legionella]|uniref:ABC transporter permease subunit n=1 Tax=Legionella septentrionalis TaxID=2498109 RepID=A0A433JHT2_9GAMM|nr:MULTISPECIES: ABC transporter permease subunit [Legionella]MCP0912919.1 ABC transporter permease subunit [Legionella sp. 27cVA30]RUQ84131.1 ABC transporter permease subunit [Legionella septentrionalis]RUQ95698.1 ABC transporter permease subunit [Legionella septentrionalis]RUR10111.1 ABC transporter permease subunit [Legionella septentrionalis]RUR15497.1 ABC transporter permease subunit [Legionella septentrionalis]
MKSFVQKTYLALIYILLYFPILVLILYSVNKAKFSLQWHGFSTRWYVELFHDRELWLAFLHSVILGLSAAIVATVTGLLACTYLFLHRTQYRITLFSLLILLVVIPDLVLGVALLTFFNITAIPLGFFSLLIAHITFCIPFVVLTINSRIHTLDANIYFCALDLGATRFTALTKILLPLLWPAVLSAFLLCFTLSFDDVIISYFVAGPDFNILPLTIYSLVRAGVTPELNALCTITFFISMILVVIAHRLARKTT